MTPVLLGLRSTSSATGTTVSIFGLRYREFASIAIMRDKKMLSLWKTKNTGERMGENNVQKTTKELGRLWK